MDAHIATPPMPEEAGPTLSARLPGEPDPDAGPAARDGTGPLHAGDQLATSGPPVPQRRRYALLTTASFVALALAGASTFLVSPYNHVMPVPRMVSTVHDLAAKVGINLDRPLAPAASLANVPIAPPAGPMIRPKYVESSRKEQVAELLRLHGDTALAEPVAPAPPSGSAAPLRETSPSGRLGTPTAPGGPAVASAASSPQGPAPAPAGYVPHEPGAPPKPPSAGVATVGELPTPAPPQPPPVAPEGPASSPRAADLTKTVVASIEPPAQPAVALPEPSASRGSTTTRRTEPVPAGTPIGHDVPPAAASDRGDPDPTKVASALRPAPLTAPDQVQVLELVTQMAAMVRDLRAQDASLRSDFAKTSADTGKRLDDFERRLVLAEARNAVASAAARPSSVAVDDAAAVHPVAPAAPVTVTPLAAALPADGNGTAKRYRVQAASPGLALLAEIDRGGGDGAQIQASVGDTIPGYGRVKSVSQHGTTWVVTTEHGNID